MPQDSFMLSCIYFVIALSVTVVDLKPYKIDNQNYTLVSEQDASGNYNFTYEDKQELTNHTEIGKIVKSENGEDVLVAEGSYSHGFKLGDCQTIVLNYVADEKGYRVRFSYTERTVEVTKNGMTMKISVCASAYREATPKSKDIGSACIASLQGSCVG